MKVYYEEVKAYGRRRIEVDGKKKYQQKTFMQTVNPFNKNEDGTVKTYAEVKAAVDTERDNWEKEHDNPKI